MVTTIVKFPKEGYKIEQIFGYRWCRGAWSLILENSKIKVTKKSIKNVLMSVSKKPGQTTIVCPGFFETDVTKLIHILK